MLLWLVSLAALSNYYTDLGVGRDATKSDIRRAFRKAAVQWHPDKMVGKSKAEQDRAHERFIKINDAHAVLSDDKERRSYDHELNYGGGSAQHQHQHQHQQRQQQRPSGFYYHNGQYYYHQPNQHYQQQQQYYRRRQQQYAQQSGGLGGGALTLVFTVLTIAVPLLLIAMPRLVAAFNVAAAFDDAAPEARGEAPPPAAPAPPPPPPLPLPREGLTLLRAKELKSRLRYYRVDASACVEKGDFVALLVDAQNAARRREADRAGAL
jgi:hypothetical protein